MMISKFRAYGGFVVASWILCLLFAWKNTWADETAVLLADLTSAPGIDKFATMVRYVYLEPAPQIRREGRVTCKATFYPGTSEKPAEIRSVYLRGGIAYKNWTPYQVFCMDVQNPQDTTVPLTIEVHSGVQRFEKTFDLTPASWSTLTLNLTQVQDKINLDSVTEMRIIMPLQGAKMPCVLYLDGPRLIHAKDAAQARKAREAEDATAALRVPVPPPRFPAAAEVPSLNDASKQTIRVEKDVPVVAQTEVLVVGGGLAGVAAAVAAARGGAKTILVERSGALGGMATVGLVPPIFSIKLVGGLVKELDDRLRTLGGDAQRRNPEFIKLVLLDMLREAGAKVLFYALATDAIVEDNRIRGIVIEGKGGPRAILAQVVVDCTGDADIAAFAGAPFEMGRGRDTETQAVTLVFLLGNVNTGQAIKFLHDLDAVNKAFRTARKNGDLKAAPNAAGICAEVVVAGEHGAINVNSINVPAINPLKLDDLTYAHIQCLREIVELTKFFRKYVPGCNDCYLIQTGTYLGVRESRRIVGEYVLTGPEVIAGKSFPDAVARGFFFIDIHNADHTGDAGGVQLTQPYEIPYRCLVPQKIDGLLVAGRPISVDHVAHGSTRIMGTTMPVGQAAGTAAAMAVKFGIPPRKLDGAKVQAALRQAGAWPDSMKRVPDNLALLKNGTKAEADSFLETIITPSADGAIDGLIMDGSLSRWVSARTPEPHWLTLTFAKPQTVRRVVLHWWLADDPKTRLTYVPTQYQIQYEKDGQWVDIVVERDNQKLDPEYIFDAVTCQRLRLFVTKVRGKDTIVRLREIEVY